MKCNRSYGMPSETNGTAESNMSITMIVVDTAIAFTPWDSCVSI